MPVVMCVCACACKYIYIKISKHVYTICLYQYILVFKRITLIDLSLELLCTIHLLMCNPFKETTTKVGIDACSYNPDFCKSFCDEMHLSKKAPKWELAARIFGVGALAFIYMRTSRLPGR